MKQVEVNGNGGREKRKLVGFFSLQSQMNCKEGKIPIKDNRKKRWQNKMVKNRGSIKLKNNIIRVQMCTMYYACTNYKYISS